MKLLEKACWDYEECEYGAPAIDCKRPYGNSDVEGDIAEILGWQLIKDNHGDELLSQEQGSKANELHNDLLEIIPQIIKEYTDIWRKKEGYAV